jgi:DNA-binding transcriptional MocR family regulator
MFDLQLSRSRQDGQTLVDQIVQTITQTLSQGTYAAGTALPSVRGFAKSHSLSAYTVVEAYQRLVSLGLIASRPGSGYVIAERETSLPPAPSWNAPSLNAAWLLSDVFADQSVPIKAGCGWIPNDWIDESGMQHALRTMSRIPGPRLGGYGHPYGLKRLRELIATSLRRYSLPVDASNILLTHGATQAIDLVVRTLCKPGDVVVVEDPCYCNLLEILKLVAVKVVGVRRTVDGIDIAEFEQVVVEHHPRVLFINTVLQNPSGSSLSVTGAFRLLQVADRYGLWVVEDDISRELAPPGLPCLAAMEGLHHVIYVSGFSKTITPAVRVGFVAANRELLAQLALTKMAIGLTSSEVTENTVATVLVEGHYDRHVTLVRERLKTAHERVARSMREVGLEVFHTPKAGLFLWARLPIDPDDSLAVSTRALSHGIWLAPGSYFRPREASSSWFRFNAATSDAPALWQFMRTLGHSDSQEKTTRVW